MSAALAVRGLHVQFGGVHAVEDVSFAVERGSVHGLVGPNGSGKTTILNAICGFVDATGGIELAGKRIDRSAPHRRMAAGLGRTFQNPRPTRDLTIREVLRLGEHLRGAQPWWRVALLPLSADRELRELTHRATALLARFELAGVPLDQRLASLPAGVLKMVDIVRALLGEPAVLLLDEPTSGMNDAEIRLLHEILRDLRASDLTVLLVEHNLRFLADICDALTVLERGRILSEGAPAEVFARPEVIRAYMGEAGVAEPEPEPAHADRAGDR